MSKSDEIQGKSRLIGIISIVKLCRFELTTEPGAVKSGIAYEGRVYETQGLEPVAIHEAQDIRLLAPISRAPTVRILHSQSFSFDYVNPIVVVGPNSHLKFPDDQRAFLQIGIGLVVGGHGVKVAVAEADELILGLTLVSCFKTEGAGGQSLDLGTAIGPLITTPDDFDDEVVTGQRGRVYRSSVTFIRNTVEVGTYKLAELVGTPAEVISKVSATSPVIEGDLIAIGVVDIEIDKGDEIKVTHPKLGTLTTRIV